MKGFLSSGGLGYNLAVELRDLRSFVTVARLNSISKAAAALHLTPAAVHKQLKNLEFELDTRLYERAGRQLRLTPSAQVLLPHATDLLARYQAALAAFEEWKGLKAGSVRLGSGPSASSSILPELLAEFRAAHPDIEVVVETGNTGFLIRELCEGQLDLALMISPDTPEGERLTVEVCWEFDVLLVTADPGMPRQGSIRNLAGVPFILYKSGSQLEKAIDAYLAALNFHPRVVMRFDNPEAIKAILRIGAGVTMLPRWAVEREIEDGTLAWIRQTEPPLRIKLVLAVRRGGCLPPPARALIETARRHRFFSSGRSFTTAGGVRRL
jgi:DNA-binding transcriptional LysR family regulator